MYTHTHAHMHTCTRANMHTHTHTHTHMQTRTHANMCTRMHTRTYMYRYAHLSIHMQENNIMYNGSSNRNISLGIELNWYQRQHSCEGHSTAYRLIHFFHQACSHWGHVHDM